MSDPNENRSGYKETKVGWIPKQWTIASFAEAFDKVGKLVEVDPEADYRQIGIRSHGRGIFHKDPVIGASLGEKKVYWVESPCLMFNIVFAWEQAIAVSSESESGFVASHRFPMYKAKPDWNPHFVAWHLKTIRGKYSLGLASPGGAGRNRTLGRDELRFLFLPQPEVAEQRSISEILTTCDEVVERTAALIEAKTMQKKSVMQQLLTGKKRLHKFGGEWVSLKMASMLSHISRPVDWADDKVFNLISVRRRSLGLFRRKPLRGDQYKTRDLHELKSGDFLISKRQVAHGALAMVTKEFEGCHVSKEYSIFANTAPEKLHMPFLNWLSRTRRMWWLAYVASNGVAIEKLIFAPQDFLKFEILLPPTIEEQIAISDILDACDAEIASLKKKLAALKQQKKALMQKLLTGQIRVKP